MSRFSQGHTQRVEPSGGHSSRLRHIRAAQTGEGEPEPRIVWVSRRRAVNAGAAGGCRHRSSRPARTTGRRPRAASERLHSRLLQAASRLPVMQRAVRCRQPACFLGGRLPLPRSAQRTRARPPGRASVAMARPLPSRVRRRRSCPDQTAGCCQSQSIAAWIASTRKAAVATGTIGCPDYVRRHRVGSRGWQVRDDAGRTELASVSISTECALRVTIGRWRYRAGRVRKVPAPVPATRARASAEKPRPVVRPIADRRPVRTAAAGRRRVRARTVPAIADPAVRQRGCRVASDPSGAATATKTKSQRVPGPAATAAAVAAAVIARAGGGARSFRAGSADEPSNESGRARKTRPCCG